MTENLHQQEEQAQDGSTEVNRSYSLTEVEGNCIALNTSVMEMSWSQLANSAAVSRMTIYDIRFIQRQQKHFFFFMGKLYCKFQKDLSYSLGVCIHECNILE